MKSHETYNKGKTDMTHAKNDAKEPRTFKLFH